MTPHERATSLIASLAERGIEVFESEGNLYVRPSEALTKKLGKALAQLKPAIIEVLAQKAPQPRDVVEHARKVFLFERGWTCKEGKWHHPRLCSPWPLLDAWRLERESEIPLSQDTWPYKAGARSTDGHLAKALA